MFPAIRSATDQDIQALDKWKADFDHPKEDEEEVTPLASPINRYDSPDPNVVCVEREKVELHRVTGIPPELQCIDEEVLSPEQFLKVDQLCAFKIIVWHLEETLAGRKPPPLRLIVNGEGGTGKSKLIEAITDYFSARGATHLLVKMAYTGIAASHICTRHYMSRGCNDQLKR